MPSMVDGGVANQDGGLWTEDAILPLVQLVIYCHCRRYRLSQVDGSAVRVYRLKTVT